MFFATGLGSTASGWGCRIRPRGCYGFRFPSQLVLVGVSYWLQIAKFNASTPAEQAIINHSYQPLLGYLEVSDDSLLNRKPPINIIFCEPSLTSFFLNWSFNLNNFIIDFHKERRCLFSIVPLSEGVITLWVRWLVYPQISLLISSYLSC